jgi:hypothetical protein
MSLGEAANNAIGALKSSPALLFLILLNLAAITGGVWFMRELARDVSERNRLILDRCLPQKGEIR